MISVFYLYTAFKGRQNTWQGGHARIKSFETWLHEIQIEMQNELIKEYEKSQVVTDNIRNFMDSVQIPISDLPRGGVVTYPKNYRYFTGLRFFSRSKEGEGCKCGDIKVMDNDGKCHELTEEEKAELQSSDDLCERDIQKVETNLWGSVCDHEFLHPTIERPYSTQYSKGFRILPREIGVVVLDYITIPVHPKLAYKLDDQQNIVCIPEQCVNLNWGEEMIPEIMARLKKRYADFTKDGSGYAQGEQERTITSS